MTGLTESEPERNSAGQAITIAAGSLVIFLSLHLKYMHMMSLTPAEIKAHRYAGAAGHIFFFLLFILALVFYKERMLNLDPAFFSFLMIQNVDFSPVLDRWGSIFSQIIPLLALKSGVRLESFLQLFSTSFILLYYIYFLIVHYFYKNTRASLVLILVLCLTFRHTFYYATAELYQGLGLSVIFWAMLRQGQKRESLFNIHHISAMFLVIVISFFHQLTVMPLLFILGYEYLRKRQWRDKQLLLLTGFVLVWYIIRIKLLTQSQYEQEKILGARDFISFLFRIYELPSTEYFLEFAKNMLVVPAFVGVIVLIALWLQRKYLLAFYTALFTIGFIALVLVTLGKGESAMMYENYFTILGLFIAFPLVTEFYEPRPYSTTVLSAALGLYSVWAIYQSHYLITYRIDHLQNLVDYGRQFENRKIIIAEKNFDFRYMGPSWAMPFETALLSSLNNPGYTVSYYPQKDPAEFKPEQVTQKNVFLGPTWEPFWFTSNNLNAGYLSMPDGGYININSSQADTAFTDTVFTKDNFKLKPLYPKASYRLKFLPVQVKLTNNTTSKLNSLADAAQPVLLSYHLYDEQGKLLKWDNSRTPLSVDIYPGTSFVQSVMIDRPDKGKYILEFDFVTENSRWWGINERMEIVVK